MCYKTTGKAGLFDAQEAIDLMSDMGNSLERLCYVVYFEIFCPLLEERLIPQTRKYRGGARSFDYVMMFKIVIL